jgi:hypothetical protein
LTEVADSDLIGDPVVEVGHADTTPLVLATITRILASSVDGISDAAGPRPSMPADLPLRNWSMVPLRACTSVP